MGEIPERYAAVIGINKYTYGVAELRSAVPDARAVAAALKEAHGYAEPMVLLDAEATHDGIVELLEEKLPALELGPGSGLLLYYAGHGVAFDDEEVPRGYLIPCDARSGVEATWLSMDRVRKALHRLRCRHLLVVLDCCFAGSFRWTATRKWDLPTPWLYDSQYARYLDGVAWQVLTSASQEELAQDLIASEEEPGSRNTRDQEGQKHSPFAAALLEGLAGQSDSSRGRHEADGVITATELYQYIFEELVPAGGERRQTPGLWPLKPGNTGEYLFLSPDRERNTRPDPPLDDANNPWLGLEAGDDVPTLETLREAIEGPAAAKALFFEPVDLVNELLEAVIGMPAALPILVLTLAEIYRQAQLRRRRSGADRALTRQDYKAAGGVEGTVHRLADELYEKAAAEHLGATFRRLALRMVSFEGWTLTRRRVSRRELKYAEPKEQRRVATVLRKLTQAHLLFAREKYLEPGHDALVRTWPRMSAWLEEAGEMQRLLRAVWGAAEEWETRKRFDGFLWDDHPRLEEAEAAYAELNRLEQEFVEASVERRRKTKDERHVAVAGQWMSKDPTRAALVLLEVTDPERTAGSVTGMLDALSRPLARDELRETYCTFSADGTRVLTVGEDHTLRVWNVTGGFRKPVTLRRHEGGVRSAAFNTDGTKVVTTSDDRAVRVWTVGSPGRDDPGPGEPVVLRGHKELILDAAFNADGTQVVSAALDDTARVWNVDGSGKPVILRAKEGVQDAAFSPDGARVVTVGWQTARVWQVGTAKPAKPLILRGHEHWVQDPSFNADGTKVLTSSIDNTARVWPVGGPEGKPPGEPLVLAGHQDLIASATFSADGSKVLTASWDNTARIWNVEGPVGRPPGKPVVLEGHEADLMSAAFSPDGSKVVTASVDGTARVWNADGSGEPLVLLGHEDIVGSACFHADGTQILTAGETIRLWNVGSEEPVTFRGHQDTVMEAAFNADCTRVATASSDQTARLWSLGPDGHPAGRPVILRHERPVEKAAFSADGTQVVTTCEDGTVWVWNVGKPSRHGSGKPVVLRGHEQSPASVMFNADGTRVVTASWDGTARVWSLGTPERTGQPMVLRHEGRVYSAVFNADGTKVLTASMDGTARVWNVGASTGDGPAGRSPGEPVVLRHEDIVNSAVFNADGTRVLTSSDNTAQVWAADGSGKPKVFRFDDAVGAAAFNADGTKIGAAVGDGPVQVWNVDGTWKPVALRGHSEFALTVAFNTDGTRILTTSADGTARVWNTDGSGEPVILRHGKERLGIGAVFNGDGTKVLTTSWDRTARLWTIDAGCLKDAIRAATTVSLDPEFRVSFLGESRFVAWKKYAECELGHGRCPRAWGFDPADPESAKPFLARLSKEAREKYEEYRSLLPLMPLPEKRVSARIADRRAGRRAMPEALPSRTIRSLPERRK